ncbi:uncharacterized protein [Aristolochia californica]|uniref:uncharacterized protein n=1 Tax=Aristolochia californica TaxID=171875 RepID=UPI0035DB0394
MAPRRGSSRKVGLKRIDAAVDALLPLGFAKHLICKTVYRLLKVYEGDDGWVFIEEGSYKLLIDTILEEQENEQVKTQKPCEGQGRALPLSHTSSNEDADDGPSNFEHEPTERTAPDDENEARGETGEGRQMVPLQEGNTNSPGGGRQLQLNHDRAPSSPIQRRRPPCYGWISDSEEEANEEEAKCISYGDLSRQRKRRWDVRPCHF